MCISFHNVCPVQLIYHESRYTYVKAIDITYPTDKNFYLNYSAVIKCQGSFKFKVTNYNTFALKNILNLLNSLYNLLLRQVKHHSSVCTTKLSAPML